MDGNFNSEYYITIATVVPLLYITLFLQGDAIQDFSKKLSVTFVRQSFILFSSLDDLIHGNLKLKQIAPLLKAFLFTVYAVGPTIYLVLAAVLAGPVAAGYAAWALFFRSDVFIMRIITLLATIGLLFLVIITPAATIVRNVFSPDNLELQIAAWRAKKEGRRTARTSAKESATPGGKVDEDSGS